ncbi:MAG: hypothetical protein NVSMB30_19110 [Hymenobacter sp.]
MRIYHIFAVVLVTACLLGCKKESPQACSGNATRATVIGGHNGCNANGFLLQLEDGTALPPDDLPGSFQQSGLKVCLTYTVYEDLRMCPCCGGTRLKIQSIQRQ